MKSRQKLIVMADYSFGLLTDGYSYDPELLGLPSELCVRFKEWLKLYREPDQVPADYDRAGYNYQGRLLAEEIAVALKESHHIVYRYLLPLKHSNDEWQWGEEQISENPR